MNAAWWWIDRWRKSTAYTDMTLAQQGAYRNLLDELWLRDGVLPLDERILGKIAGDAAEWPAVREIVMARFERTDHGYRHSTHDEVAGFSQRQAEKGRIRAGQAQRINGRFSPAEHQPDYQPDGQPKAPAGNQPPSPSPSPSLISGTVSVSKQEKDQPLALLALSPPTNGNGLMSRFEEFWLQYPNKVGKAKASAWWQRKKPDAQLTIAMLAALSKQKMSSQWTEQAGRFIPHPTTWLNRGGWDDQLASRNLDISPKSHQNIAAGHRAVELLKARG